jgi:hypothetical protein
MTTPADELRAAAASLRQARFPGAMTATPSAAALIRARLPLADWLDEEADGRDAAVVAAMEIWGSTEHPDAAAWLTTGHGKASAHALAVARAINGGQS